MREPANKPVNDLQIIKVHMVIDMAWKIEPIHEMEMNPLTKTGAKQRE